jgi:hypothetical protein
LNYIIYKITIPDTNKSYIGYTSKTLDERLSKHIQNVEDGIKSKHYNALRKYGCDNLIKEIIATANTHEAIKQLECYYIKKYDTYKNGYNSTKGGDGGWIIDQLSQEQQSLYWKKRSELTSGLNNPNSCGLTDDEIIDYGIKYYLQNEIFTIRSWYMFAKENNLPQSFSKNRFGGEGFKGFKKKIAEKLNIPFLESYKRSEEHKAKLSKASSIQKWYNNGVEDIRLTAKNLHIEEELINKGFVRGRVKNKK